MLKIFEVTNIKLPLKKYYINTVIECQAIHLDQINSACIMKLTEVA